MYFSSIVISTKVSHRVRISVICGRSSEEYCKTKLNMPSVVRHTYEKAHCKSLVDVRPYGKGIVSDYKRAYSSAGEEW